MHQFYWKNTLIQQKWWLHRIFSKCRKEFYKEFRPQKMPLKLDLKYKIYLEVGLFPLISQTVRATTNLLEHSIQDFNNFGHCHWSISDSLWPLLYQKPYELHQIYLKLQEGNFKRNLKENCFVSNIMTTLYLENSKDHIHVSVGILH